MMYPLGYSVQISSLVQTEHKIFCTRYCLIDWLTENGYVEARWMSGWIYRKPDEDLIKNVVAVIFPFNPDKDLESETTCASCNDSMIPPLTYASKKEN